MRRILHRLRNNIGALLAFRLVYGATGVLLVSLFYNVVFRNAVDATVGYLAPNTFVAFATHPLTWLCLILLLLVLGLYNMAGIYSMVYLCECSRRGIRVLLRDVLRFTSKTVGTAFRPRNWKLLWLVLLAMPLVSVVITPIGDTISLPDFVMEFISYYPALAATYAVLVILIAVLLLRWRFIFSAMVLEGLSFSEATAKSVRLGKGHHLGDFGRLVLCRAFITAVAIIVLALSVALYAALGVAAEDASGNAAKALEICSNACALGGLVLFQFTMTLNVPLCYSYLTVTYCRRVREQEGEVSFRDLGIRQSRKSNKLASAGAALACIAFVFGLPVVMASEMDQDENPTGKAGVVAHRCGAHYAPENTIAALEKAASMGVSWCEIDAQQLADGTIIVMHDTNFARTTGFNKNSWEATWSEVEPLDAGSFYDKAYAGEPIPTLDAMVKAAKAHGIKLQIEVKPTGNEANLEQAVVDIVLANDFQNECVVASQNYASLEKVRAYSSAVRTLYITSIAYGDMIQAQAADDFSIEATWITEELVDYLHANNRKVFAWTVNSEDIMENTVMCGIDALVSDEVETAVEITNEYRASDLSSRIAHGFGL